MRRHGITWPNGYGAEKTIDALIGALPTIFVVGRDGRIVWNDDRVRYGHDVADFIQQLEAAIELALNEQ